MKSDSTYSQKFTLAPLLISASVILFSMLEFICGAAISPITVTVPVILLLAASFFIDRRLFYSLLICCASLALWSVVCGFVFDSSYDGMYYHKQAVITLKEGWNPILKSSAAADVFANYLDLSLWLDNYPKGLWAFSAAIYSITNRIETAKAINILPLISVFAAAFDVLRLFKIRGAKRVILSLLFALNPMFICQLFTFYNDLAVGSLIILAALVGIKIYKESATGADYLTLFLVMSLSCTVKFTAPLFVGLTLLAFGICCLFKWRDRRILKPVAVVVGACVFGVAVLGAQPYITHLINGQNIIFPILGENKTDIMNENPPPGFDGRPAPVNLAASLASRVCNDIHEPARLKIPFSIHKDELLYMSNADVRVSGFGVWFGGILLLTLLALLVLIFRKKIDGALLIPTVLFTVFALVFSESWWARYASFIYYIPLFLLTALFCPADRCKIWGKCTAYALCAAFLVNAAITLGTVTVGSANATAFINKRLDEVAAPHKKVIVRVNDFTSHVKLFSERGIDFEVSHTALENPEIFYLTTKYKYAE